MRASSKRVLAWLVSLAVMVGAGLLPLTAAPVRAEVTDTPVPLVNSVQVNEWAVGAGLAYWGYYCSQELTDDAELFRRPLGGGPVSTVQSQLDTFPGCDTFQAMHSADDGIYYHDRGQTRIARLPLGAPFTPETVQTLTAEQEPLRNRALVEANGFLYWVGGNAAKLFRTRKDGTSAVETVANTNLNPTDLIVVGNTVYWTDSVGVFSTTVNCATLPCGGGQQFDKFEGHTSFAYGLVYQFIGGFNGNYRLYWVARSGTFPNYTYKINYIGCNSIAVCFLPPAPPQLPPPPANFYTATTNWVIGDPLFINGNLFWTEFDGGTVNSPTGDVKRQSTTLPASPATLATNQAAIDDQLYTANGLLYYARRNNGIYSLSLNATAIERQFANGGMEVTQAIQNLANDVLLVADKPTYVRVYGTQVAGPNTPNVEARLIGLRGGNPLPGSPLKPVNGVRRLVTGVFFDRARLEDGWYFLLPASWTTVGQISLEAEIDPRLMHNDPNRADNDVTDTVTFQNQPPVCVMTVPVRTHTPLPSVYDPNVGAMISQFNRRWPVPDTWVFRDSSPVEELELCTWYGVPYPCFGPYELQDGWGLTNGIPDRDKVIASLWLRAQITFNPDVCDDIGAPVHFMGLVHPTANNGGAAGYASTFTNQSWVQLPDHTPNPVGNVWNSIREGSTMAQELAHNYGRQHVDCNNPDDPDDNYPYPPCQIAEVGPASHYGFDTVSLTPITPNGAADFMSYAYDTWVSDYTWSGLLGNFAAANAAAAVTPALADANASSVLLTGLVDLTLGRGAINVALVLSTTTLPPATQLIQVQNAANGGEGVQPAGTYHDDNTHAVTYRVRMLTPGGTVAISRTLTLLPMDDHVADSDSALFVDLFPMPASPIATIQLLANNTVVYTITPGLSKPTVSIQQPTGGAQINNSLTIQWTADDPDPDDRLTFIVQYSHDAGASWQTLAQDIPATPDPVHSLTLTDLSSLHGSAPNAARIRVLANDGYNTARATSAGFTLSNRPPVPMIYSPTDGAAFPAGPDVILQGTALDAEDGGLSGAALQWQVNGAGVGSGAALAVAGLAPGDHTAQLAATDSNSQQVTTTVDFAIAPLNAPLVAPAPVLDGLCDDAAYGDGSSVLLAPYGDATQGIVQLVRSADHLWVCFSGLQLDTTPVNAFVGVRADINHSRNNFVQSNDAGFFVGEDGSVFTRAGTGNGSFDAPGPGGLAGQVSASATEWRAELRIDRATLNDWDHLVGLSFGHYEVGAGNASHHWPFGAIFNRPRTWAATVLGRAPQITLLAPASVTAPGASITLSVTGSSLVSGTVVLWNGAPLPTTYISDELLTAQVDASLLTTAGIVPVAARGPAPGAFVSNELAFAIQATPPTVTGFNPVMAKAETPPFTLFINGNNFAPGAQVLWNGQPVVTTFVSPTRVRAAITAELLQTGQTVGISVFNTTPAAAVSPVVPYLVRAADPRIYLPLIEK